MIKIEGTKNNALRLYVDWVWVGTFDMDHNKIRLNYTKQEMIDRFGDIDLSFAVADYYNEIEITEDGGAIATVDYEVIYEEEEN